jgi:hypothetical protein
MLVAAARRLAIIFGSLIGGTVVISILLGLAAGSSMGRAISVGLYVLGAALLVGSFVFGIRGPVRGVSKTGETVPIVGARGVRHATGEERRESGRTSLFLFAVGLVVIVVGSLFDPVHKTF